MTRSFHHFDCESERLAGTLDEGHKSTGLLIVSGGNEIRAGAHAGMAKLAQSIANRGYPVFRYDRRGIGDSGGTNAGFMASAPDIAAASEHFRIVSPKLDKIVGFGNCDAATALALFTRQAKLNALILANPWVIDEANEDTAKPVTPPPSAIRARYWKRLTNPATLIDLFKGRIDFRKLRAGLKTASKKQQNSRLALKLKDALLASDSRCEILLAARDTTALAFEAAWKSADYGSVRKMANITIQTLDSASHSFADEESKTWLEEHILAVIEAV